MAGNPFRWIETWLLYSQRPSAIFEIAALCLESYWKKNSSISHYFMFNHYLKNIDAIYFSSAHDKNLPDEYFYINPHLTVLNWHRDATKELVDLLLTQSSVHKLTYALRFPHGYECGKGSVQEVLLRKEILTAD